MLEIYWLVSVSAADALLVIGLPDGPTAHFKLSKLVLRKDIKVLAASLYSQLLALQSPVRLLTSA